jgi:hypothetical protein
MALFARLYHLGMSEMGLGRVKTLAAVARVEYHRAILYHDS